MKALRALQGMIAIYLDKHPAPWPPSVRAFDVTGHCVEMLLMQSTLGYARRYMFEARLEIAAWIDELDADASPRECLEAYLETEA